MPVIQVDGPPIDDIETRRKLIGEITKTCTEVYGLEADSIIVLIRENGPLNVGVHGELLKDRFERRSRG